MRVRQELLAFTRFVGSSTSPTTISSLLSLTRSRSVSARSTRSANERSPRRGSTPSATGSGRRSAGGRDPQRRPCRRRRTRRGDHRSHRRASGWAAGSHRRSAPRAIWRRSALRMSSGRATADRLYAALKLQLAPAGMAGRAASATSSELWVAAALLGGHIGPELLDAAPETVAEQVVEHRLERLFLGLWLSLDDELTATVGTIHVRPLRSAVHAAFTLPLDNGGLIVMDDAAYDLTHTAATVMMASWGSPDAAVPGGAPPPVPFNDAVRVLRAELGSMRWNGALWQPVRVLFLRRRPYDRLRTRRLGDYLHPRARDRPGRTRPFHPHRRGGRSANLGRRARRGRVRCAGSPAPTCKRPILIRSHIVRI